MSAALAWARAQLRHRWVMLLGVGVLAGLAGAATLSAIAGARRTATVLDRHLSLVGAPDAGVGPDFDPTYFAHGVLDPYYEIGGVETYTEGLILAMRPVGTEFFFILDRSVVGALDDRFGTDVSRFRIVEGRAYDHRSDDEVVLSEAYAEAARVGTGDVLRFESWSKAAVQQALDSNFRVGEPDGPIVDVTVVGVAREVEPFIPNQEQPGTAYLPAGFTTRWASEIGAGYLVGAVRLVDGAAGFEAYRDAALAVSDRVGVGLQIERLGGDVAQVNGAIDAQVLALLVLAVVAGAAGTVVVYASLSRHLSFAGDDQLALRAAGMTRRERMAAVAMLGAPAAGVAAVLSAGLALPVSGLMPIATPGRIEPDPGLRADPLVLVTGAIGVALVVVVLAGAVGASVTRRDGTARIGPVRTSAGVSVAGRLAPSAPSSIGVRQALDRGRGDRVLPTRSTLVGCAVGVIGVVAALSFAASLDHLASTPRLYGWAADAMFLPAGGSDEWSEAVTRLESDEDLAEVATVISTTLIVEDQSFAANVVDLRKGDPFNVVISGRPPRASNELAIGARVAGALGVGPGDRVSVALADGAPSSYTVVGIAAHPNEFDDYRTQIALLGSSTEPFLTGDEGPGLAVLVRFADGVDAAAVMDEYRTAGIEPATGGQPPRAVTNLDEVRSFPLVLATLLALLAVIFLLHALTAGVRRRGRDLAVLKTLGFTTGQLRAVFVWQATTIAVVSLLAGVPLGLGIGRIAWAAVADGLDVVTEHGSGRWSAGWVLGVMMAANLVGLVAARRAVRIRPAAALRAALE